MKIERRYFKVEFEDLGDFYIYVWDVNKDQTGKFYASQDHRWHFTTSTITNMLLDPDATEISEEDAVLELI